MNKQSVRHIFEQISDRVISFLENHAGVTNIEFFERQGVVEALIHSWEEENSPYLLPDDLKSFLQISDGLLLTWNIRMNDQISSLGKMHLNRLKDLKKVRQRKFRLRKLGDDPVSSDEEEFQDIATFDLDNEVKDGRLGLVYNNTFTKPQVYFQDLSSDWFFIANSFTDYFRLMVMHLGLPHWQYAFTEVGLDTTSQQWFRFLLPERLAIDINSRKTQVKKAKKHKKETKKERFSIHNIKRRRNATGFYSQETDEKQRDRR